ncbi:hypothetical protein SLS53_008217 [Cytospora paraplurivora]|uniref:Ankyrin repeat protein n=1 Tax=Cytospora paraplurivora TaxID=2898453 RepID=A0AAN9YBS1_9PEZI
MSTDSIKSLRNRINVSTVFAKQIADEIADIPEALYITERDATCDAATNVLQGSVDISWADQFGNTPLHLFAALDSDEGTRKTLHLLNSGRANPAALNNAGQTFLHILSPVWFSGTDSLEAPLYTLLNMLYSTHLDLVFVRDVYGRTFFHQLQRLTSDPLIINNIIKHYAFDVIPRDAFGVKPPSCSAEGPFVPPRRAGTIALSPLAEEAPEDHFAARDARLMAVVNRAYEDPATEDGDGRNGLHCLAELHLTSASSPNSPDPSSPGADQPRSPIINQGSLKKRKHGKDDVDKPINKRLQFLQGLLTPVQAIRPPDVNHYDNQGNNVLIAFATHLLDDQDDKTGQNIGKILGLLIQHGANIDARNRHGETALLVAARCGNKHVVSNLLDKGANLYARDKYGRGIMAVIDAQIAQSSRDLPSYGRLEAVRAAVLAKKLGEKGGNDEPSFVDEWCWPQRRQGLDKLT